MSWETGDGAAATSSAAAVPAAPAAPVAAAPAAAAAATGGFSPDVEKWLAAGKKWSKSAIAAEQARRKRNNVPALTDPEVTALLGEPAGTPAAAPAPAASAAAAAAPRQAAAPAPKPSLPNVPPLTRSGTATTYVGTPAVGTSKAASAGGIPTEGPDDTTVDQRRRRLVWSGVAAFLMAWFLAFFRFFLPRTLF